MSTFTGAETIANIVTVSKTIFQTSGTEYTVPAGRYAEVHINYLYIKLNADKVTFGSVDVFDRGSAQIILCR